MPDLQYFPPTEAAGSVVFQIPTVRATEVPTLGVSGPEGARGPEAAGAILHLHMTMVDEEKTRLFWDQVAVTLEAAATTHGLIRFVAFGDGLSTDAVSWWLTVDDARAFARGDVHRAAMKEMYREKFEYTHFAGLWQLVETRERHVYCDACGAATTLPHEGGCPQCGNDLADVFKLQVAR